MSDESVVEVPGWEVVKASESFRGVVHEGEEGVANCDAISGAALVVLQFAERFELLRWWEGEIGVDDVVEGEVFFMGVASFSSPGEKYGDFDANGPADDPFWVTKEVTEVLQALDVGVVFGQIDAHILISP